MFGYCSYQVSQCPGGAAPVMMNVDFAPESLGKGALSSGHGALIPVIPVIPVIPAGPPEGSHGEGVGAGAELQGLLWALG